MNPVLVIPAHLGSKRLKEKLLIKIKDLPIIEHVRRRAILSNSFKKIYIITSDMKIKKTIESYGGSVILSKKKHNSGTSRVSEITKKLRQSKIVILFGDELLIEPKLLAKFALKVRKDNKSDSWNATSFNLKKKELLQSSVVKCFVNKKGYITNLSRKIDLKKIDNLNFKILKSVGILAYKKSIINKLNFEKTSKVEKKTKIEQFKVIENSFLLKSVPINFDFPSVNIKKELDICINYLKKNKIQKKILDKTLNLNI